MARLFPPYSDFILSSLTVVQTPSPLQTTTDNNIATQTGTPHTVAQLQHQVHYLQEWPCRYSKSPTSAAIRQLTKSVQLAMNSATILAEKNRKLSTFIQRQERMRDQRRHYIACGGAQLTSGIR